MYCNTDLVHFRCSCFPPVKLHTAHLRITTFATHEAYLPSFDEAWLISNFRNNSTFIEISSWKKFISEVKKIHDTYSKITPYNTICYYIVLVYRNFSIFSPK